MQTAPNSTDLCTVEQYLETATGKKLFPSVHSFEWYLRKNKDCLIKCGAVIVIRKRWHVLPEKFYNAVLEIGTKLAAQKLAA